jgi:hypothetical protein
MGYHSPLALVGWGLDLVGFGVGFLLSEFELASSSRRLS